MRICLQKTAVIQPRTSREGFVVITMRARFSPGYGSDSLRGRCAGLPDHQIRGPQRLGRLRGSPSRFSAFHASEAARSETSKSDSEPQNAEVFPESPSPRRKPSVFKEGQQLALEIPCEPGGRDYEELKSFAESLKPVCTPSQLDSSLR